MRVPTTSMPNSTQVPQRATLIGRGDKSWPARVSTTSAAKSQKSTAKLLAILSPLGNRSCVPPQAAFPHGAAQCQGSLETGHQHEAHGCDRRGHDAHVAQRT